MTRNQKTFNHVYKHLIRQNEKAVDSLGACSYRGNEERVMVDPANITKFGGR
jgi:hypothetical protein